MSDFGGWGPLETWMTNTLYCPRMPHTMDYLHSELSLNTAEHCYVIFDTEQNVLNSEVSTNYTIFTMYGFRITLQSFWGHVVQK